MHAMCSHCWPVVLSGEAKKRLITVMIGKAMVLLISGADVYSFNWHAGAARHREDHQCALLSARAAGVQLQGRRPGA